MSQYQFGLEDEQLKAMVLSDLEDFSSSENKIDCSKNKAIDQSKFDNQNTSIMNEQKQIIGCNNSSQGFLQAQEISQSTNIDSNLTDPCKISQCVNPPIKNKEVHIQQRDESENEFPQLVKHNSEIPQLHNFLLSKKRITKLTLGSQASREGQQQQQINELKEQLKQKNEQICKLQDTLTKITNSLAKIYSSPELLSKDIEDKELLKILSEGFLSQAKLHLAFLFSSPLILKYKDAQSNQLKSQTIVSIDHAQEFQGVVESLSLTGSQIRYRKIPATLDNLRMSMTENPIALHFSGHGIENNKENFGKDSALIKGEGNFLIFEDKEGCAQYLSEKRLHELLDASGTKLEFVFVASCYSQFAGEIFHNAGAKHVICVRRGEKISDEASIIFSKHFYHALFSQTRTVCQAFEIAKASLHAEKNKYVANEYHKFIILKDTDCLPNNVQDQNCLQSNIISNTYFKKAPKKHKCSVFGPFMKGQVSNIGTEPMFKLEVSKVEDFLGRRKEMQEVISNLMENRLVTIKGIPGIGKTTLAKAVGFYLDERNYFDHGIILLTLRRIDKPTMFLTRLYLILHSKMVKAQENEKEEKAKMEDQELLLEKIIEFLKDKRILIILDNVEDPLRVQGNEFKEILQTMLTRCPWITLLLTSRIAIGSLADISEKIIHLKELTSNYSLELLFKKAMRPIDQQEIEELLKSAEPVRVYHINPHRENKFSLKLEDHHFLHLLGGHPHAISLAAPLLQDKSLKELYALLNSYDILDILGTDLIEGKQIAPLKMSLETSIEHMKTNDPDAMKLFCLMGLLPGGCSEEDLDNLWGQGWSKCTERLLRASLLVKKTQVSGENKFTLLPFMNKFAEQKMTDEERLQFHKKCCQYYGKICKQLFYNNQNQNEKGALNMNEIMNRLIQIETNIWACIYRMLDYKKSIPQDNASLVRGKSPLIQLNQLMLTDSYGINQNQILKQINKSNEESSQGESFERLNQETNYDFDKYEQLLCKSTYQDRTRSNSVRNNLHQRSLLGNENNQQDLSQNEVNEDEEEKSLGKRKSNQTQQQTQYLKVELPPPQDIDSDIADIEDKILYNYKIQTKEQIKDNLLRSQEEQKLLHTEFFQDQDQDMQEDMNIAKSQQPVYPTHFIANMLSDDFSQSFNQSPSAFMKISDQKLVFGGKNSSQYLLGLTVQTDESENESVQSHGGQDLMTASNDQNEYDLPQLDRQTSEENNITMQLNSRVPLQITKKNLQLLPIGIKQWPDGEDSAASSIMGQQDYLETSSVESFLDQQFGFSQASNQSPCDHYSLQHLSNSAKFKQQPRKSLKTLVEPLNVVKEDVDKESCDNSINMDCEIKIENNEDDKDLSDSSKQLKMQKRISSKKYQEDEEIQQQEQLQVIDKQNNIKPVKQRNNYHSYQQLHISEELQKNQLQENDQNKKKKTVVFKLQKEVGHQGDKTQIQNYQQSVESKTVNKNDQIKNFSTHYSKKVNPNWIMLDYEGDLLVHYISNLILFYKYADAYKAIQQFGMKIQESITKANLIKLSALVQFQSMNFIKEPYQQFEESLKIFKKIDSIHGQASCNLAMGYMLYTKAPSFNDNYDENTTFNRATKRITQALDQYKAIYHYMGQAFCHKLLSQIREKQNKKDAQVKKHFNEYKALVRKYKELQSIGKSLFIMRSQAGELTSLLIEIANYQYEQSIEIMEQYNSSKFLQPSGIKPPTKIIQRPGSSMKKDEDKAFSGNLTTMSNQNERKVKSSIKDSQLLSLQAINFNPKMQFKNEYETQKQILEQIKNAQGDLKDSEGATNKQQKQIRQIDSKRKRPMVNKIFHKSVGKLIKDSQQNAGIEDNKGGQDNQQQQQQLSSDTDVNLNSKPNLKSQKKKVNLTNYGRESVKNYQLKKSEQIEKKKKILYNNSSFIGNSHNDQQNSSQLNCNSQLISQTQNLNSITSTLTARKSFKKTHQIITKDQDKKSMNQSSISISTPFQSCQVDDQEDKIFEEVESDKSLNRSNKSIFESNTKEELQEIEVESKRFATLGGWNNQSANSAIKGKGSSKGLNGNENRTSIAKIQAKKELPKSKNSTQQSAKDLQNTNDSKTQKKDSKQQLKLENISRPLSPHQQQKKNKEKEQQYNCDSAGQVSEGTSSKQVITKQKITFNLRATMTIEDEKNKMISQKDIQFNVEQVDQDS